VTNGAGRAAGQQRDNRPRPKALRRGVAADGTPGIVYDKEAGSNRWGPEAVRPDFVEVIESLTDGSPDAAAQQKAWDSLALAEADPDSEFARIRDLAATRADLVARGLSNHIAAIGDRERKYLVRLLLRRMVELGQLGETAAFVLLRLIGGPDRLVTEHQIPPEERAEIKDWWRRNPSGTGGQAQRKFGRAKSTVLGIKREVDDES
jgi:hypothetical protein